MLRVNRSQLKQLSIVYDQLQTIPTKHGVYIVANEEDTTNYRRFLRGDLSKKQKSALYWYYRKLHSAQEKPTGARKSLPPSDTHPSA